MSFTAITNTIDTSESTTAAEAGAITSPSSDFLLYKIFIGIGCTLCFILSLIGNLLVVSVIIRYKRLKNATNYILLSLAIADLTVSFLVMIPASIQDITDEWIFSDLFCQIYNAFDITCCTASILHLLLVAVDRYIAIFKPLKYKNMVRKWHVFMMVFLVWTLSLCMSFIPIFMGWNLESASNSTPTETISVATTTVVISMNDNHVGDDPHQMPYSSSTSSTSSISSISSKKLCMIEANKMYGIVSSSLSFYIPLIIMTVVYIRIFIVARRQANAIAEIEMRALHYYNAGRMQQKLYEEEQMKLAISQQQQQLQQQQQQSDTYDGLSESIQLDKTTNDHNHNHNDSLKLNSTAEQSNLLDVHEQQQQQQQQQQKMKKSSSTLSKTRTFINLFRSLKTIERRKTKDTKAIKTLGIIMGIFIICWLPFFINYLVQALFKVGVIRPIERIMTWLGYINSFINPIVYALTNKSFRKAYTATLRSCARYLCPRVFYIKLIERKNKQSAAGTSLNSTPNKRLPPSSVTNRRNGGGAGGGVGQLRNETCSSLNQQCNNNNNDIQQQLSQNNNSNNIQNKKKNSFNLSLSSSFSNTSNCFKFRKSTGNAAATPIIKPSNETTQKSNNNINHENSSSKKISNGLKSLIVLNATGGAAAAATGDSGDGGDRASKVDQMAVTSKLLDELMVKEFDTSGNLILCRL